MKKFLTIVLIISMIFSTYCVSFAASTLKDIKGTKYETAVKSLVDLGIISGYPDGTFKPDNAISRSELSKLLVISYGLEKNVKSHMGKTQFSDVNAVNNHWASGYINLSTDYKFVTGYPDGTFKADNTVTYAEAMTMCVRVLGYSKEAESKGTWPTNYINKAQDLKLTKNISIKSYDKEATRGDIAILIWNMINTKVSGKTGTKNTLLKINFSDNKVEEIENDDKMAMIVYASNSNNFLSEDGITEIEDNDGELLYYVEEDNDDKPLSDYKNGIIVYTTTSEDEIILQSSLKLDEIKKLEKAENDNIIKEINNNEVLDYNGDTIIKIGDSTSSKQDKQFKDYLFVLITIDPDESDKNFIKDLEYEIYEDVLENKNFFKKDSVIYDDDDNEVMYIINGFKLNNDSSPSNPDDDNNNNNNNASRRVRILLDEESDIVGLSTKEYNIIYIATPEEVKIKFEIINNETQARIDGDKIIFGKAGVINIVAKLDSDGYEQPKGTELATFTLTVVDDTINIPELTATLNGIGIPKLGKYKVSKFHSGDVMLSEDGNKITGILNSAKGFKEFSSKTARQKGYFLVLTTNIPFKNVTATDFTCYKSINKKSNVVVCRVSYIYENDVLKGTPKLTFEFDNGITRTLYLDLTLGYVPPKDESTGNTGNTETTEKVTDYIFTGDSRFAQMHSAVDPKGTKHWLNKGAQGYDWINSNKSKLTAKVIIWNWGVNDGLYSTSNRNKVINKYKKLLTSLAESHIIYVVSVNPLGSAYTSKHTLNNSHVKAFNSAMKEFCDTNDNLIYVDTYNKFYNDFIKNTSDGLHYNSTMNKKLYNYLCEEVGIK